MEQDIADLLNDAFSDTFLSPYQDEDLNFDTLNFHEGDEERNETTGHNKLSVLTEVDESEEVLNSISEEDHCCGFPKGESWNESRISQSPNVDAMEETSDKSDSRKERDEDDIQLGTIEEVDSKEDKYEDTVTESQNKEDSSEEKDKGDILELQKISNEEMGSVERREVAVVQKDTLKNWDSRDEMEVMAGEESSNEKLDSTEVKDEVAGMDKSTEYPSEVIRQQKEYFQDQEEDGSGMDPSPEYSSDVIRKWNEYFQEQEEDIENAQSGKGCYVTDEEEENDASRRKHEELYHGLCSLQADRQENGGKTHATESNKEEIYKGEKETMTATGIGSTGFSKGLSAVENEDAHISLFEGLLEPQSEDDIKEFSEDDLGVIGEDYAEYPSECFQQKDKGERSKKVEDMQVESTWKTAKLELEATSQLGGGEIFEWELLERHTEFHDECSETEETARDIPDEKPSIVMKNLRDINMFLEKQHTEQQDSEEDFLRKEDQGTEENRPVKDEIVEGIQEEIGLTYSFTWKKTDLGDSEPQNDTVVFDMTYSDFLDMQIESGNEFQIQNNSVAKYCSQESCDKQYVSWTAGNERQSENGRSPEGNEGLPMKTSLMESLCDLSAKAIMASSDMNSGVGDLENRLSLIKSFETPSMPTTWSHKKTGVVDSSRMTEDCEYTGEMSTWMVTPSELTLKVNWAEDPLITETRNSQKTSAKVWLAETGRPDRDLGAEEQSLVAESGEEMATDVLFQYETNNVIDAQKQKFLNYDEEEECNSEQGKQRTEAYYQKYNDVQNECGDTRQGGQDSKKHTIRFSLEPSFQRDSGSSDQGDGVSSSSDSTEDCHTSQTRQFLDLEEDSDDYRRREDRTLLQQSLATQRELLNVSREIKTHHQKNTISKMVKSFLKICLTTMVGVFLFWWATGQLDWMDKPSVD